MEGALRIDPFLLAVSVKKLAEEQLAASEYDSKIVTYLGDGIVITQLPAEDAITRFTDCMDKICKMAKRVCKAKITAGIGHVCSGPEELQMSYLGAKNAVSYRVLYGNTRAINIAEIDPQENADLPWEEPFIQKDHQKGQGGRGTAASGCDCGIYGEACWQQDVAAAVPDSHYGADHGAVAFRGRTTRSTWKMCSVANGDVYTRAMQLESTDALREWLCENCLKLQKQVQNERQDTTKSFVSKAIDYVKEHYADTDLGIETICGYLNVSAAYFPRCSKKRPGRRSSTI